VLEGVSEAVKAALATLALSSVLVMSARLAAKARATTVHLMFTIKLNPFLFG
jgi:hypothetical protein